MSNHAAAQAAFPSRWFDFPSFRFFVIAPVFPSFRLFPSFRRKPESTRCDGLRFSPERRIHTAAARAAFPSRWFIFSSFRLFRYSGGSSVILIFPVIPAKAGIYALQWTPVFARATDPHRRRTGSVSKPVVRFFRHSDFSRHSGESRNLRTATDSGFRQSDGSTPKPPERKHCPPHTHPPPLPRFQPCNLSGRTGIRPLRPAPRPIQPDQSQNPENPRQNDDTGPLPPPNPLRHTQSMSGGEKIRFRQSPKEGNGH